MLRTRIRNNAMTCIEVLYAPRSLGPHADLSLLSSPRALSLRESSARKMASDTLAIDVKASFDSGASCQLTQSGPYFWASCDKAAPAFYQRRYPSTKPSEGKRVP